MFLKVLDEIGLDSVLSEHLPELASQSRYKWKDVLYSYWSIFFCGGDCIEDLGLNLKQYFESNSFINTPGPDCILRRFKELSLPAEHFKTKRGEADHQFSIHQKLNELSIAVTKKLGGFDGDNLTLDYDNTIISNKKSDSRKTYKRFYGYNPAIATIGNNVVYVENRNGNSDSKSLQDETLFRAFEILERQQIEVTGFRADAASYTYDLYKALHKKVSKLYIAVPNRYVYKHLPSVTDWIEFKRKDGVKSYVGETKFVPFKQQAVKSKEKHLLRECRLVVTKRQRVDRQTNLLSEDDYHYHAVVTTDDEMTASEVMRFYHQRGNMEKLIGVLKNDFGWSKLPFSKLEENTVHLVLSGLCNNIYNYIIAYFSKRVPQLKAYYRIKKFLFRFIVLPTKWIRSGRQNKLKVFGQVQILP